MLEKIESNLVEIERTFDNSTRRVSPIQLLDRFGILKYYDRAELRTYASEVGRLWEPANNEQIKLDPPKCKFVPAAIQKCTGKFEFPPVFTAELTDSTLVGPGCLAITDDRHAILETTDNSDFTVYKPNNARHLRRDYLKYLLRKRNPRTNFSDGPYALLASRWADNYYHWLLDYLPQLRAFKQYEEQTGERLTLILNQSPPRWLVDSLRLMGYDNDDWIEWTNEVAAVDRLVVSTHTRYSVLPSITAAEWVGETLCGAIDVARESHQVNGSRIYISRKDADIRRVVNEEDLVEELKSEGVEKYVLSELTLEQQIRLFATAELIVAPHGAGLVNMLFAESPRIVELMGSHTNPCHYCLASGLGYDYTCLKAEPRDEDMWIDPNKVLRAIYK